MDALEYRDRFKDKTQKENVVRELSHLTNDQAASILGIDPKYWSRVKTKFGCNFFQLHNIEY
jgi:hypothetical protein